MNLFIFFVVIGAIFYFRNILRSGRTIERKFELFDNEESLSTFSGQQVKIKGIVQPQNEYLKSPISGRSCIFYEVKVEVFTRVNSRGGSHLELLDLFSERNAMKIIIENESKDLFTVQLANSNLEFISKYRTVNVSNWLYELVESEIAFLKKYRYSTDYPKYIFTETIIQDSDCVEVIGAIHKSDDKNVPYNIMPMYGELFVKVIERFRS
jgi:hypothetical protein